MSSKPNRPQKVLRTGDRNFFPIGKYRRMEAAATEESPVLLTTCALFPALSLGKINRCCDSPNSIRVGIPMSVFPVSRSIPRHRRPQETTSFLFLGQTSPELDNAVFMILSPLRRSGTFWSRKAEFQLTHCTQPATATRKNICRCRGQKLNAHPGYCHRVQRQRWL